MIKKGCFLERELAVEEVCRLRREPFSDISRSHDFGFQCLGFGRTLHCGIPGLVA